MGAHICSFCNCEPCHCKQGEGRHAKRKERNDKHLKMENEKIVKNDEPILGQKEVDALLKGIAGPEFDDEKPSVLDTVCGSCGQVECDCVNKEPWMGHAKNEDWDKATIAAQMEDLGDPYLRMAKCVVMCDAADIDLPKWCKEALLGWARKEVGGRERYLQSC